VKHLVESVSQASQQQSHGIEQVAQAVAQMERITQRNAASAEESAASGEELHAKAQTALEVVRRLETLVDVERKGGVAAPAATRSVPAPAKVRRSAAAPSRRAA
jgi:methyl-accepting chemotaxis protein